LILSVDGDSLPWNTKGQSSALKLAAVQWDKRTCVGVENEVIVLRAKLRQLHPEVIWPAPRTANPSCRSSSNGPSSRLTIARWVMRDPAEQDVTVLFDLLGD